jgi:FixJ family two-component response regulator
LSDEQCAVAPHRRNAATPERIDKHARRCAASAARGEDGAVTRRPQGDDQFLDEKRTATFSHSSVDLRATADSSAFVFVVDDDPLVREVLSSLIRSVGLEVSAFASAAEFQAHRRPNAPSCLVLDVRLPGVSGLDLQRALIAAGDTLPIIFITGHGDIPMSVAAMKAGAVEFLSKPFRDQDLLDAIGLALARDSEGRSRRAKFETTRTAVQTLTLRERQVMEALLAGQLNKQVAARLGISEVTVKLHRRRLLRKMKAPTLVELARMIERMH